MHAIKVLGEDHQRISTLLGKLSTVSDASIQERARLLERLQNDLLVHVLAEDNVFLPQVADAVEDSRQATSAFFENGADRLMEAVELIAASYENHREVASFLEEVKASEPDSHGWKQKLEGLQTAMKSHIEREERLFSEAEVVLEEEDFERIGDLIEHCKGQVRGFDQAKLASSSSSELLDHAHGRKPLTGRS